MSSAGATLIVGGSGFIGLNLAEAALAAGQEVLLADRNPPPEGAARTFDTLPGRWQFLALDVTDRPAVEALFREHAPRDVFYGAAITSGEQRERAQPHTVLEVNLLGLTHVLAAASAATCRRLVNISSGSAYGEGGFVDGGGVAPLDEQASRALPNTLYSVSKLASEGVCRRIAELTGLDAFSVRLAAIYGPWELDSGSRDTLSAPMQAAILARRGEQAMVARRDARDWTYSRHVAAALLALMAAPSHGFDLYNVSTGVSCSLLDIADVLARHFPGFAAHVAAPGETINVELHGERDRCVMSPRRLSRDIGHVLPTDLAVAVDDFADWISAHPRYWSRDPRPARGDERE
jgi:nucleoside-diphosphate-sugar epimerase